MAERMRTLIAEVLAVPRGRITLDLRRDALPEWDSLAHLRLMTAIEDEFAIRPTMAQISELNSVHDLAALVGQR